LSTVCLNMYSITENIYHSQLSSVAILLQPEPVSHRIIQVNDCVFSPSVLSSFGLPLPPTRLVLTVSEARSYFASTVHYLCGTLTVFLCKYLTKVLLSSPVRTGSSWTHNTLSTSDTHQNRCFVDLEKHQTVQPRDVLTQAPTQPVVVWKFMSQ
jgi:hypothetical protein